MATWNKYTQLFLTYLTTKCTRNQNLLGPFPLGKLFLAAAVVALLPVSLEAILESAKCQDVVWSQGAVPHKKTTLITFLPGYQRRFPAKTETETQLIDRLEDHTFNISQQSAFNKKYQYLLSSVFDSMPPFPSSVNV